MSTEAKSQTSKTKKSKPKGIDVKSLLATQRAFFTEGGTRSYDFRLDRLRKLKEVIEVHEEAITEALQKDFKKSAFETYATEIGFVLGEIEHARSHLASWMGAKKVGGSLLNFPSGSYVHSEPYGICLIMGAWNYPLQLTFGPLVGAIAAGNCAIVKPSELAKHTSAVMAKMISENFDEAHVKVVEGGKEIAEKLLAEKLDYIFFTGSVKIGKIVMQAAAQHLTPVTLELGGKSPCIIDKTADLGLAAKRIAWGKFLNGGQTCVAPDYLLIHKAIKPRFVRLFKEQVAEMYGEDPQQSPDYPRIINEAHYKRLVDYLKQGRVLMGGKTNDDERYIAPTMLDELSWDDQVMQEEIFGPILPIIEFEAIEEAAQLIANHPKPLALYLFSENNDNQKYITEKVSFGGGCINDTVAHLVNTNMPFGGVGDSGIGSYHGRSSFQTFSHQKSVMKKATWLDVPLRYAPYKGKMKWLKMAFRWT